MSRCRCSPKVHEVLQVGKRGCRHELNLQVPHMTAGSSSTVWGTAGRNSTALGWSAASRGLDEHQPRLMSRGRHAVGRSKPINLSTVGPDKENARRMLL